jgi:hypothetical protein
MRIPLQACMVGFPLSASYSTEITSNWNWLVDASRGQFTDIGGDLHYRHMYITIGRVESGRNDDFINKRWSDRAAAISVLGFSIIIGMLFYIMYELFYSMFTIGILIVLIDTNFPRPLYKTPDSQDFCKQININFTWLRAHEWR